MSKALISGNGKGNSAIIHVWLYLATLAIFAILFSYGFAYKSGFSSNVIGGIITYTNFIILVGTICVIICVISGIKVRNRIAQTKITVYDDRIEGIGGSKIFPWVSTKVYSFNLTYDQITSVDATKNFVSIYTVQATYRCYVPQPNKIYSVILQVQKIKKK